MDEPNALTEPLAPDSSSKVFSTTHFLSTGWVIHWLGLFVYTLPFKLFLKNHFHLEANQVAPILFLAGMPFTFKPIFAWIGDSFPIKNLRRKPWTVIGGVIGAIFFGILLIGSDRTSFYIGSIFLASTGYVFVSCSLGGLMVEFGTRNGVLGALSSYRGAINQGVNILVGPLSGYLASQWIGWTWGVCAGCAIGSAALIFGCVDRPIIRTATNPLTIIGNQFRSLISSKSYWFAILATALITIAPGFGTALTFYQQDVLKLTEVQIGTLTMFNGIGGLTMGLICVGLAKRFPIGRLFLITTTLNALGTLGYMAYNGFPAASLIEPIGGFVAAGTTVAIFTLAGHATPKGVEGLGYSILMSVSNLVLGFGDMFGANLYSKVHLQFPQLVLINCGTTLFALVILPLMPKSLKAIKDGVPLPPSESKSQSGHIVD